MVSSRVFVPSLQDVRDCRASDYTIHTACLMMFNSETEMKRKLITSAETFVSLICAMPGSTVHFCTVCDDLNSSKVQISEKRLNRNLLPLANRLQNYDLTFSASNNSVWLFWQTRGSICVLYVITVKNLLYVFLIVLQTSLVLYVYM